MLQKQLLKYSDVTYISMDEEIISVYLDSITTLQNIIDEIAFMINER